MNRGMPPSLLFSFLLALGLTAGIHTDIALAPLVTNLFAACLGGAWFARHLELKALSHVMLAGALMSGAALHGVHAVDRAEHSSLRRWFDERIGGWSVDRSSFHDDPVRVRGRLTRDAALTPSGASMQIAVSQVSMGGAWESVEGGLSVSVGGALASDVVKEWRAGRLVEFPVALRTAARYLNAGVPDGERALARRGTALVGSVKSGALVEVLARGGWWDERAADVRAAVRSAMARHVGRHDPESAAIGTAILIGDRAQMTREIELRLQEAGTYHVVAISGGNIALLAAAVLTLLWAIRLRFAAGAVVAVIVPGRARLGDRRRPVRGAGHAHGNRLSRLAGHRPAHRSGQRDRRRRVAHAPRQSSRHRQRWFLADVRRQRSAARGSSTMAARATRVVVARCGGYLCWQPRGGTGPHAGIGPGVRACDDGRIGAEPGRGPGDGRGAGSGVCLRDGRRDRHRVSRGRGGLGHVWRGSRAGGQQPAGGPGAVGHLAGPGAVTLADGRVLRVARGMVVAESRYPAVAPRSSPAR